MWGYRYHNKMPSFSQIKHSSGNLWFHFFLNVQNVNWNINLKYTLIYIFHIVFLSFFRWKNWVILQIEFPWTQFNAPLNRLYNWDSKMYCRYLRHYFVHRNQVYELILLMKKFVNQTKRISQTTCTRTQCKLGILALFGD